MTREKGNHADPLDLSRVWRLGVVCDWYATREIAKNIGFHGQADPVGRGTPGDSSEDQGR